MRANFTDEAPKSSPTLLIESIRNFPLFSAAKLLQVLQSALELIQATSNGCANGFTSQNVYVVYKARNGKDHDGAVAADPELFRRGTA